MNDIKKVEKALKRKFLTKKTFCEAIENEVGNYDSYIECIVEYCQLHGIDLERVKKLVNQPIKEKLQQEFEELHYLPKTARLPGL